MAANARVIDPVQLSKRARAFGPFPVFRKSYFWLEGLRAEKGARIVWNKNKPGDIATSMRPDKEVKLNTLVEPAIKVKELEFSIKYRDAKSNNDVVLYLRASKPETVTQWVNQVNKLHSAISRGHDLARTHQGITAGEFSISALESDSQLKVGTIEEGPAPKIPRKVPISANPNTDKKGARPLKSLQTVEEVRVERLDQADSGPRGTAALERENIKLREENERLKFKIEFMVKMVAVCQGDMERMQSERSQLSKEYTEWRAKMESERSEWLAKVSAAQPAGGGQRQTSSVASNEETNGSPRNAFGLKIQTPGSPSERAKRQARTGRPSSGWAGSERGSSLVESGGAWTQGVRGGGTVDRGVSGFSTRGAEAAGPANGGRASNGTPLRVEDSFDFTEESLGSALDMA